MTTQLTLQGLLDALASVEQNATLMLTGLGPASYPGLLFRHRPFLDGLAIAPSLNRAHEMSAAQYAERLREFGLGRKAETFRRRPFEDQYPAGPHTPMWISARHDLSFYAVTGIDMVKGYAVIRTTNMAPVQGPSLQRIPDDEVVRRMQIEHLQRTGDDIDLAAAANRYLIRLLPKDRSAVLQSLDEARDDLAAFEASLQARKDLVARLELDAARHDYLLGIRDDLPKAWQG